jgi:Cu+-exporting ATPase
MEGNVSGHDLWMGAAAWLESRGVRIEAFAPHQAAKRPDAHPQSPGSAVHVAVDGHYRGCFLLTGALRTKAEDLITGLTAKYELALLSGDNDKERERFRRLFGDSAHLHFNQGPLDKLEFIRRLQQSGGTVMMVGDGLNDAGALKQSDVGLAVVENISAFSPASDGILCADGFLNRFDTAIR